MCKLIKKKAFPLLDVGKFRRFINIQTRKFDLFGLLLWRFRHSGPGSLFIRIQYITRVCSKYFLNWQWKIASLRLWIEVKIASKLH